MSRSTIYDTPRLPGSSCEIFRGLAHEGRLDGSSHIYRVYIPTFDSNSLYTFQVQAQAKLQDRANFQQNLPKISIARAKYCKLGCQKSCPHRNFTPKQGQDFQAMVAGPCDNNTSLPPPPAPSLGLLFSLRTAFQMFKG